MGELTKRREKRSKQPTIVMVTDSCGCVFCDIGLEPQNTIDGKPVHYMSDKPNDYRLCTALQEHADGE
jgi:hypothetical protein